MEGVTVLLGAPVEIIDADVLRGLRGADGSEPCREGLAAGLAWLGGRSLPLSEAVREARADDRVSEFVAWALAALGYGSGYGSGYGDGSGDGYGCG